MIVPRIGSALRRTARIAVERPRQAVWTMLALTAAMFIVGLAGLAADHLERWTSTPRGGASMVVYLGESVDEARAAELAQTLDKLPGVDHAELVSATDSAARLQQALGADSALLEGVELASLPASVEVTLQPGVRDVIAMSPTVRALKGTPGVDDVVIEDAGSDKVLDTLRVVRLVAWTAAALLAGLALLIVLATIRVQLDRPERELAVAHLLGASSTFTIVPTAFAGAIYGAFAALVATMMLLLGVDFYGGAIARALDGALGAVTVSMPGSSLVMFFIGLGAAVGFVGGGIAGASRAVR